MTQPGSERDQTVHDIVAENVHAIGQLIELLENLPGRLYRQSFGQRKQHVIGKHVRHIIDHYSALLSATASPGALLDYENRNRDLSLETDRRAGANRLSEILRTLRSRFSADHFDGLAMLHTSDEQGQVVKTSVDRELVFLASHTIHPSTLRYLQRQASGLARSA